MKAGKEETVRASSNFILLNTKASKEETNRASPHFILQKNKSK